jgi:hypothetical protein
MFNYWVFLGPAEFDSDSDRLLTDFYYKKIKTIKKSLGRFSGELSLLTAQTHLPNYPGRLAVSAME